MLVTQFTDPQDSSPLPTHLDHPDIILDSIWALPDHTIHALGDAVNSSSAPRSTDLTDLPRKL